MKVSEIRDSFYERGFWIFGLHGECNFLGLTMIDFYSNCDKVEYVTTKEQAEKYFDKEIAFCGEVGLVSALCIVIKDKKRGGAMTLEEKANEYARNYVGDDSKIGSIAMFSEAYIAGAKANGIEWHDLRKTPNDLPNSGDVIIGVVKDWALAKYSFYCLYFSESQNIWHYCHFGDIVKHDIIAWCEIPNFEER